MQSMQSFWIGWLPRGYLKPSQRHNWCAVEAAINTAFYAAVSDGRPELSPQNVIEYMLRHPPPPR
jgi:hypothetical protein